MPLSLSPASFAPCRSRMFSLVSQMMSNRRQLHNPSAASAGGCGGKLRGRGAGWDNPYNKQTCASNDHGGRCCPTVAMGPHSWRRSTAISKHAMQQVYVDKTKTKKISLLLFVRLSRSLRFGKFACLMITGCDGCTADAEHQRQKQQRWHIC